MASLCVWIGDAAAERRVFGEIAPRLGLQRENSRYQMEMQAALGLLSRLHVLAGIGLRSAVEARLDGKEKRPVMLQWLFHQADT